MASSSAVYPFSSRQLALEGNFGASSEYIEPLEEWTSEKVMGGVKYTTRFKVPYRWSDRVVLLRMEGVTNSFSIEVNNEYAGYSQSGIGRSQFNLTKLTQENYNTLSVTVYNNTAAEKIEDSRSHAEAGFASACIISQPKVRIKDLYVDAVYDNGAGLFNFSAVMESHLINSKEFRIYYELLSPSGEKVAYGDKVLETQMYSRDSVYFFARIPEVLSWTHEMPVLYTLVVKTQYEGRYKEYVAGRVGFTDFGFDADGNFSVNGRRVVLVPQKASWQGDYSSTESALETLKSSGANLILAEGHPQPDEFYTICDRLGLYVCNQVDISTSHSGQSRLKGGNPSNAPEWTAAYVERAEDMYLSSKNHPSVIAFSLAGENSANGIALYEAYLKLKSLEYKRPVFYASAHGEWNSDKLHVDRDAKASVGGIEVMAGQAAEGIVMVRNTSEIATLKLRAEYVTRRGAVKYAVQEEELSIAPGQTVKCDIPLTGLTAGREKNSVDITLYDACPVYEYDIAATDLPSKVLYKERLSFYTSTSAQQ